MAKNCTRPVTSRQPCNTLLAYRDGAKCLTRARHCVDYDDGLGPHEAWTPMTATLSPSARGLSLWGAKPLLIAPYFYIYDFCDHVQCIKNVLYACISRRLCLAQRICKCAMSSMLLAELLPVVEGPCAGCYSIMRPWYINRDPPECCSLACTCGQRLRREHECKHGKS